MQRLKWRRQPAAARGGSPNEWAGKRSTTPLFLRTDTQTHNNNRRGPRGGPVGVGGAAAHRMPNDAAAVGKEASSAFSSIQLLETDRTHQLLLLLITRHHHPLFFAIIIDRPAGAGRPPLPAVTYRSLLACLLGRLPQPRRSPPPSLQLVLVQQAHLAAMLAAAAPATSPGLGQPRPRGVPASSDRLEGGRKEIRVRLLPKRECEAKWQTFERRC